MPLPTFTEVHTMNADQVRQCRTNLVATAQDLVTRSAGSDTPDMSPADAETFDTITRQISILDQRARQLEIDHATDTSPLGRALTSGALNAGEGSWTTARPGHHRAGSVGEAVTASEDWTAWVQRGAVGPFSARVPGMEFRAVTDVTLGGAGSGGTMTRPERQGRVGQDFLDRRVFLVDELPHVNVSQGSVEYVQDNTPLADLADAAREVAESGTKPQAGVTMSLITESAAVIATWANITRQALADAPQLQSYLDGRMRYALKRRADKQMIAGTGTSPNLRGLLNRSGILTYAPGGAEARYKSIRHAMRLGEDVEAAYELIVLNPADAELFDLSNDTTAGLHAADADGGIRNDPGRTAWGLRQVRSTAIPAGTALLIDPMAVAVLDRQEVVAYTTDAHGTNFTSNICTILLEARLGLAVYSPSGVLKLTFNGTT